MPNPRLDKLIKLYRDGYISREELIRHSKKVLPNKGGNQHRNSPANTPRQAQPNHSREKAEKPVIELDLPPIESYLSLRKRKKAKTSRLIWVTAFVTVSSFLIFTYSPNAELAELKNALVDMAGAAISRDADGKLRRTAEALMKSTHWSSDEVQQFQQTWEALAKPQQQVLAQSLWYKKFSLYVALQIAQLNSLASAGNSEAASDIQPLQQLSATLGNDPVTLTDPITRRDTAINPAPKTATTIKPRPASPRDRDNATVKTAATPTRRELNQLLATYSSLYEKGQINEIMSLFKDSGWNQGEIGNFELRERFQETFAQTKRRKIHINNVHWSYKGTAALGTGELKLSYIDTEEAEVHHQVGNIRLVAERKNKKLLISHLYHIF